MSVLTDVLAAHRYRPEDRSCSCDENWYDLRPDPAGDLVEHFLHVEKQLLDAGVGEVAEAQARALEEAALELTRLPYVKPGAEGRSSYESVLAVRRGNTDAWLKTRAADIRNRG